VRSKFFISPYTKSGKNLYLKIICEDYLILKLERKVEIIDNEFEEERTTVKAIIAKLPQVILNLIPVRATKRQVEQKKSIYVVHLNFFVTPARFLLYKEGMSGVYGIRHSRSALNEFSVLEETMFPLNMYSFVHGKLPLDNSEIVFPVNVEYERMVFRFNFSNAFTQTMMRNKKNRMSFKVYI